MNFAWHSCHAGNGPPMQPHVAKQAVNIAKMRTLLQRTCLQILPQQHPAAAQLGLASRNQQSHQECREAAHGWQEQLLIFTVE